MGTWRELEEGKHGTWYVILQLVVTSHGASSVTSMTCYVILIRVVITLISVPHGSFWMAIEDCGLTELDFLGGDFTWEKCKGKPGWVRESLDQAFANEAWWRKFPLCQLSVSHTIMSDHDPIMLEPVSVTFSRKQFRFKFENTWLNEPSFKKEVSDYWKSFLLCIWCLNWFLSCLI